MQLVLRYLRSLLSLAVCFSLAGMLSYPGSSMAQTCPAAYTYPSCAPAPAGCSPDGYPAIVAAIYPPACFGELVFSTDGKNTNAGAAAPAGQYVSSQNGLTGYECWELAARYFKFRWGIDMNQLFPGEYAGDLVIDNNMPSNIARHPADGSYTPVCGDLIAYCGPSGACRDNAGQLDHVDLVTNVVGQGATAAVTTLNEDTTTTNPWSTGTVIDPAATGNSGVAYLHATNNTNTGATCETGVVSTSCPATMEPFALSVFHTGIALVVDGRGDLNAFVRGNGGPLGLPGISQNNNNSDPAQTSWVNWNFIGDPTVAHDPVAVVQPDGNGGQMMDLFYIGEDGNIWHDFQTGWVNGAQNTPTWNGAVDLIGGYTRTQENCADGHCHPGDYVPTQLLMPQNVTIASNLAVALDAQNLIHIVFFGAQTSPNSNNVIINVYDVVQATPHDEYEKPPDYNLWKQPKLIGSGAAVASGSSIILPAGSNQSIPSGHPTIIADQNKILHIFYRSDNTDGTNYDRGFIYHIYQTGNGWSVPAQVGYNANGTTIYPVVNDSNIDPIINPDGRIELFYRGAEEGLWHIWQTAAGVDAAWDVPKQLGERLTSDIVSGFNQNGQMEVFYRDNGGDIRYMQRYDLNNGFPGDWGCHVDVVNSGMTTPANIRQPPIANSPLAIGTDTTSFTGGRLQVFYAGTGNDIWYILQSSPNSNSNCTTDAQNNITGWCSYGLGSGANGGVGTVCIPWPSDIGGSLVEAQTCYGSAANSSIGTCQGLDNFIQSFEAYVPYCYWDSNDQACTGPSVGGGPGGGNCTFGIGTLVLSTSTCSNVTGSPSVCSVCTPTQGGPGAYAGTGIGCATQTQASEALVCADQQLNTYLQNEIQTLFGGPNGNPPGLVNASQVSKLNACQQAALIDYAYQYGAAMTNSDGSLTCPGMVMAAINAGAFNTAEADFTACGGYPARRQAEQAMWNQTPCSLQACTAP